LRKLKEVMAESVPLPATMYEFPASATFIGFLTRNVTELCPIGN
jgi:hypothetical protein